MDSADWDSYAKFYDEKSDHGLSDPAVKQKWNLLITSHLPSTPIRIIDLGGGTGSITQLLAEVGHNVTYVDSSFEMTKLAKIKCSEFGDQIKFLTCPVEELDQHLEASQFDVIFARFILMGVNDLSLTLKKWHELLKDGGYFLFIEGYGAIQSGITPEALRDAVRIEMGVATSISFNESENWEYDAEDKRYLIISK